MTFRTIFIPAADQKPAQALCKGLAPIGGDGMFLSGCCPKGSPVGTPATMYVNSGPIGDDMAQLLPCKFVTRDTDGKEVITLYAGQAAAVPTMALKVGITTTLTKIKALYARIDVSDQEPFPAMDRLGLELCRVALP